MGAPAAEQRADTLEEHTIANLEWLDGAARSILEYKHTAKYQKAVRSAGSRRGAPGITAAEQAQRAELRRASANVRKGRRLAERWSQYLNTSETIPSSDWALLQRHWNGNDVRHMLVIQRRRGDRRITMPTLWKDLAHMQ